MKKTMLILSSIVLAGNLITSCGTAIKATQDNNKGFRNVGYYTDQTEQNLNGKSANQRDKYGLEQGT